MGFQEEELMLTRARNRTRRTTIMSNDFATMPCTTRAVNSEWFDILSFSMVTLNAIFVTLSTLHSARCGLDEVCYDDHLAFFRVIEGLFVIWYTVEVILKMVGLKSDFYNGRLWKWNIFDLLLLLTAYVEIVLWLFQTSGARTDFSFLRLLRFVRLFRLFRAFRFLTELRIMMVCMAKSIGTFTWSLVLLIFMLYVSALLSIQIATSYRASDDFIADKKAIEDRGGSSEDYDRQVQEWFSNLAHTMVLLYQCAASGRDWSEVYDVYLRMGTFQALFFLFFIMVFQFSFFNIVTAIFVNKALRLGAPEQDKTEQTLMKEKLLEVLAKRNFDENEDTITASQLDSVLRDRGLRALLRKFGLDVREVQLLFEMLTRIAQADTPGHSDELSVDQFVDQIMKIKGVATNQDLLACRLDLTLLVMQVLERSETLARKIDNMQPLMEEISDESTGSW